MRDLLPSEGVVIPAASTVDEMYDRIVAGSHRFAARVDVLLNREVILENVPIVSGSVSFNRRGRILSSFNVSTVDPLRLPAGPDDPFSPFGYELQIFRGVKGGGGEILAPLGVFPIQDSSIDGVTLLTSIAGMDRSQLISDALFEDAVQIVEGSNVITAIQLLVEDAVPGLEFLFPSTTFLTPLLTYAPGDDRLAAIHEMARSIGHEFLFDGLGRCVLRPEPSLQSEPVGVMSEGVNLIASTLSLNRGPAVNRVVATSNNASTGESFRGVATDDDPGSATQYGGQFGKKVHALQSAYFASDAHCQAAADAYLAGNLGVAVTTRVTCLIDARRETSDVVQVNVSTLGIDQLHIVDEMTIGLAATDVMTASIRAQGTVT
jgi:hypothetical protein